MNLFRRYGRTVYLIMNKDDLKSTDRLTGHPSTIKKPVKVMVTTDGDRRTVIACFDRRTLWDLRNRLDIPSAEYYSDRFMKALFIALQKVTVCLHQMFTAFKTVCISYRFHHLSLKITAQFWSCFQVIVLFVTLVY